MSSASSMRPVRAGTPPGDATRCRSTSRSRSGRTRCSGFIPRPARCRSDRRRSAGASRWSRSPTCASSSSIDGEHREDHVDSVIAQPGPDRMGRDRSSPTAPPFRCGPIRSRSGDPAAPKRRPSGAPKTPRRQSPARYHRPRWPTGPNTPPPARSPVSASSTARRCSPGRTARCCWATSGPRSSRSSHPRATRPAAGVRRGSARSRPAGPGRRPTSSRSTATSGRSGSTSRRREGAEILRRLLADADVLVENFRGGGFARLGFDDAALARPQPAARPPGDLRLRDERARPPSGPATTSSSRRSSGLMSITGAPDAEGGGPTKVGVAISDVVTGHARRGRACSAALVGREREAGPPASGAGQRIDVSLLGATLASLVNQAQNAFVVGRGARPARQRPSEHRPVRDVRDGRRRARGRGRVGAAVAAAVRGARAAASSPTDPRFATNGDRVEHRAELRPILARASPARTDRATGSTALDAAGIPCGPINDIVGAFASPEARRARDDGRAGAPGVRADPPGRASRSS